MHLIFIAEFSKITVYNSQMQCRGTFFVSEEWIQLIG